MSYGKEDFLRWDDDDINLDLLLGDYTCSEVELSDDETVYSTKEQPPLSVNSVLKTYKCSECPKTYSSISGLRGHLNKKHAILNVKGNVETFVIPVCIYF